MLVYALVIEKETNFPCDKIILCNWLIQKTGSTDLMSGLTLGAVIGGIHLFGIITGNMFAGNPMSLSMVDGSYTFILFAVMGAILGAWQKK
jgi:hypothetical protein